MKSLSLVFVYLLCLSSVVSAAEVKKEIDTDASVVSWSGQKKVLKDKHNGKIKVKEGFVVMDEKGQPKTAQITLDMASITNEDLKDKEYNAKLVGHLSSADFFDVKKYPVAILNIKNFAKDNVNKNDPKLNATIYKATGDLKIKDTTEAIGFDVQVTSLGEINKGVGKLKIDRTRWGVKYGSDSFFKGLGDKVIANDMDFDFDLVTKKAVAKAAPKK